MNNRCTPKCPCGLVLASRVLVSLQRSPSCRGGFRYGVASTSEDDGSESIRIRVRGKIVRVARHWATCQNIPRQSTAEDQWRRTRNVQPRKYSTRKRISRWLSRTSESTRLSNFVVSRELRGSTLN